MIEWGNFKKTAPELAAQAEELFERSGVVLVGTIRKDGSPRISPVEPLIVDGKLYLGMMWRSLKAQDLLRDPRCTVHTTVHDRMAKGGEFKLHGMAHNVEDLDERARYCEALFEKIDWKPEEPNFHLFSIKLDSAGFISYEKDEQVIRRWKAHEPVIELRRKQYPD